MTCPHCHGETLPSDRFCGNCGAALAASPAQRARSADQANISPQPDHKVGVGCLGKVVTIGIVLAIVFAVSAWYASQGIRKQITPRRTKPNWNQDLKRPRGRRSSEPTTSALGGESDPERFERGGRPTDSANP